MLATTKMFPNLMNVSVLRVGLALVMGGLLATACAPEAEELSETPYFDLPTLVRQQVQWLDSLNPPVVLQATIGDRVETETMQKDSARWAETLALFRQSDINQPVLQGQYEASDSVLQDQNLRLKAYRSRQADRAEIPYLRVYYRDTITDVRRIETAFQEDNLLYSTYRKMWMNFTPYRGQPRVTTFETVGKQKMILRDSVIYTVQGEVQRR